MFLYVFISVSLLKFNDHKLHIQNHRNANATPSSNLVLPGPTWNARGCSFPCWSLGRQGDAFPERAEAPDVAPSLCHRQSFNFLAHRSFLSQAWAFETSRPWGSSAHQHKGRKARLLCLGVLHAKDWRCWSKSGSQRKRR